MALQADSKVPETNTRKSTNDLLFAATGFATPFAPLPGRDIGGQASAFAPDAAATPIGAAAPGSRRTDAGEHVTIAIAAHAGAPGATFAAHAASLHAAAIHPAHMAGTAWQSAPEAAAAQALIAAPTAYTAAHPAWNLPPPASSDAGVRLLAVDWEQANQALDRHGIVTERGDVTSSIPSLVDLTNHTAAPVSSLSGLYYSIPKAFYHSYKYGFSEGADGFSVSGSANVTGGVKGGLMLGFGTVMADYPVMINPQTVGSVQDGRVFHIDPTLVSTQDASFQLSLPVADLKLKYGVQASAGVKLATPSVTVSVDLGFVSVSYTISGPSFSLGVNAGGIESLPQNEKFNVPGGYLKLSEIKPGTYSSTPTNGGYGSLPTISGSGTTTPFLQGQVDLLAALANYVPDLKAIDGSASGDVYSAQWSLLSLPLSASLSISENLTLTPVSTTVSAVESVKGVKTNLGTHALGTQFLATAPASGTGAIDVKLSYSTTLTAQAALSLFGSFGIELDGPSASATILGYGFGFSSLFSLPIYSKSGDLGPAISLPSTMITLTGTQTDIILFGPESELNVLTTPRMQSYSLGAGGERLKVDANVTGSSVGIIGTLGPAGIYNYATIAVAVSGSHASGIYLPGGTVVNHGVISTPVATKSSAGAGILLGATFSSVTNYGSITGFDFGVNLQYGDVKNIGTHATISGTVVGVLDHLGFDTVDNGGTILGQQGGVALYNGGYIFNAGIISGASQEAVVLDGAATSTLVNTGTILSSGGIGVDLNAGTIVNSSLISANIGIQGLAGALVLENSGTIVGAQTAVNFYGSAGTLIMAPGAVIEGSVVATAGAIELLAGNTAGTLAGLGQHYAGFTTVQIDANAVWTIAGTKAGFAASTITGLGQQDHLVIDSLAFTEGETATLIAATDVLDIVSASGSSILATVNLTGTFTDTLFQVNGNATNTYVQVGPVSVATLATSGIVLNGAGFYREPFTIDPGVQIGYSSNARQPTSFAIDARAVSYTATITSPLGVTTYPTRIAAATITNEGMVAGQRQGIYLQTAGKIVNTMGATISARGYGIMQQAGYAGALIMNTGRIYGGQTGINIGPVGYTTVAGTRVAQAGATIVNHAYGYIGGGVNGVSLASAGLVDNIGAAAIEGGVGAGVVLNDGGEVDNLAAYISGHKPGTSGNTGVGIRISGAAGLVVNDGVIIGQTGITMSAGGTVENTYSLISRTGGSGFAYAGYIKGASYGVAITGGAGIVINDPDSTYNGSPLYPIAGATIFGVSLGNGGTIANGWGGYIQPGTQGKYAVNTGSTALGVTLVNQGHIGAIQAEAGDRIYNGSGALISKIVGRAAPAGGVLTIVNQGELYTASGTAVSLAGAVYLTNTYAAPRHAGPYDKLATIEGQTGIVLGAGGTVVNHAGASIRGDAADAIDMTGGTLRNYGSIVGHHDGAALAGGGTILNGGYIGGASAGVFLTSGTLINSGTIASSGGTAVAFGASAATLIIDAQSEFHGNVVANQLANDQLVLSGAAAGALVGGATGTLAGLGIDFTGFTGLTIDAGAIWTLGGQGSIGTLSVAGTLDLSGTWRAASPVAVSGYLQQTGTLLAASGEAAVDVVAGGSVANAGTIIAGAGVYAGGSAGSGASSALLQGGRLTNNGLLAGGTGSASGVGLGGTGGNGATGGGALSNYGVIGGGTGGYGQSGGGTGGAGASLSGLYGLLNAGTLQGGVGGASYLAGGNGGAGLTRAGIGSFQNTGVIIGGAGGANVALQNGAGATAPGGNGGTGASLSVGDALLNAGSIQGGAGGYGYYRGGAGGTGARVAVFSRITNDGTISGGAGATNVYVNAGAGGTGVYLLAASALTNAGSGVVQGGAGGVASVYGGAGGTGVMVTGGSSLTNAGRISGGAGGNAVFHYGKGGAGGTGMVIAGPGTYQNSGTITGGAGGSGAYESYGGNGGAGVVLNGGTLITSGTIGGGAGGASATQAGTAGAAILFGSAAATLEIDPGAVFNGAVVANASAADILDLAGSAATTLAGLGTQFTGFSTLAVAAGADWIIAAKSAGFDGAVDVGGTLQLAGSLVGGSGLMVSAGGDVLSTGAIAAAVVDNGTLSTGNGKLTVAGAISGAGTLSAKSGKTLKLAGGGDFAGVLAGAGTIQIAAHTTLSAGASLAASHITLSSELDLAAGVNLANSLGHTLKITAASGTLAILGTSGDALSNMGTLTESGAGVARVDVGFANTGSVQAAAGQLQFLGAVTNSGTIEAGGGGIVSLASTASGTGHLAIAATGTLALSLGAGTGQAVSFLAHAGLLQLGAALDFQGSVAGFGGSAQIELLNTTASSLSYAGGVLTVDNGANAVAVLHLTGNYNSADFTLTSDTHGNSFIDYV